jgi:hypothetical protein
VPVRTVLQWCEINLNIVAAIGHKRITLRLVNVPWDGALEIVYQVSINRMAMSSGCRNLPIGQFKDAVSVWSNETSD